MPPQSADPTAADRRRVEDSTCPACGLLCDDIAVTVAGGRIVEVDRACERGRSWFLGDHRRSDLPEATIDGRPAPIAEAIDHASTVLGRARSPVVAGLSGVTVEAQAVAVLLADRLGATIGPSHAIGAWPRVSAIQRAGIVTASLGEVANRADVIILWGVDPTRSHPRLRDRLVDRPGRFVPGGRGGRTVLVVDDGGSDAREWADASLAVPTGGHAEAIRALRAAVLGIDADPGRVERATGVPFDSWRRWADRLKAARYGAILFDVGLSAEGSGAIEALMRLLDDLNAVSRCVALPLAGPSNPSGAEAVLTGRLGSPMAVDLADGAPRFLPGDADPEARLRLREADAILILGDLPLAAGGNLASECSAVRIGPTATARPGPGLTAIRTATPGIDGGGTLIRSDEVSLPLRPPLEARLPTDREVLMSLLGRIDPPATIG